jgi:hypothetical protein
MNRELVNCGVPFDTPGEGDALHQVQELGFTAVQLYTFWREFESQQHDGFGWAARHRKSQLVQAAGLQYIPFC